MTQGNIGRWKKKEGDKVSAGDVLVEIETDKATMDLEAQEQGYLAKILLPDGTKEALIETPLCVIAENSEDVKQFKDFDASSKEQSNSKEQKSATATDDKEALKFAANAGHSMPAAKQQTESLLDSIRPRASPLAKSIAKERNINLHGIEGTGPNGRIIKADIENYNPQSYPLQQTSPSASPLFVDFPLTNMRRVIASRLQESKQNIPHYYLTTEVCLDELLKLRESLNSESDGEYKLSLNDFIIKASAKALLKVPTVNSSWQETFIRQYQTVDINVAVSTANGLITPIVKDADKLGLLTISQTVKELALKARESKLLPHEYQGGTFTISNLGMYGVKQFTAIINPPQSGILAVGASEKKSDNRTVMTVCLSCDHRVIDGAVGAQWLQALKSFIEHPLSMLI